MENRPLINKDILLDVIRGEIQNAISFSDTINRIIPLEKIYYKLAGIKNKEEGSGPFKARVLWNLVLEKLNSILRLDGFFKLSNNDTEHDYGGFFTVSLHLSHVKFINTWNKYRIVEELGRRILLLGNDDSIYELIEHHHYAFSGRYFILLRGETWYLYRDKPWDPENYTMKFVIDNIVSILKRSFGVILIESTIGLLFIINMAVEDLIFKLNTNDGTVEKITSLYGSSQRSKSYGSGGIYTNGAFYNYKNGKEYPDKFFDNWKFVLDVYNTGVLGIDILETTSKKSSWVNVFDGLENKELFCKYYELNHFGEKVIYFIFDTFIGLAPDEHNDNHRIIDINGDQIYYSETEIIGMTRKDDGTGYIIWK